MTDRAIRDTSEVSVMIDHNIIDTAALTIIHYYPHPHWGSASDLSASHVADHRCVQVRAFLIVQLTILVRINPM